jgi:hypothetical protein
VLFTTVLFTTVLFTTGLFTTGLCTTRLYTAACPPAPFTDAGANLADRRRKWAGMAPLTMRAARV